MLFRDRTDAAQKMASEVRQELGFDGFESVVGLARGGVPIAHAVAREGKLPMEVLLVDDEQHSDSQIFVSPFGNAMIRKYDGPKKTEFMVDTIRTIGSASVMALFQSIVHRQNLYNNGLPRMGTRVLLCDDGIVSGKTVRFAAQTMRQFCCVSEIVLVTPVIPNALSPKDICVDEIVFLYRSSLPQPPTGMFYHEFDDVSDEEVVALAQKSH